MTSIHPASSARGPDQAVSIAAGDVPAAPALRRGPERSPLVVAFAVLSVAGSLVVRVVHRDGFFSGWDVMAQTQGYFLASTRPFVDVLREVFWQNRHYWLPFSLYSAPFSLIPGYLERLWPWEQWAVVVTFLSFVATMFVVLRAAGLRVREGGLVLLALGASPLLLSYAVTGYPWISALLPHALALWIVGSQRLRRSPVLALVACALTAELSWHVYELGKTVFVVFLAAAVLERGAPLRARLVWLLVGAGQLWEVMFVHRTTNVQAFTFEHGGPRTTAFVAGAQAVAQGIAILGHHVAVSDLDLPVLLAVGVASLCFFRRRRTLLAAMLLVQLALVLVLATFGEELVRPRRAILLAGYCLFATAYMSREASPRVRWTMAALLVAGNLWQAEILARFVRAPVPPLGNAFMMPYVFSAEGVGMVTIPEQGWLRELRARVDAGARLLLLYNFDCYPENFTNPAGILERLYLSLGHDRFVRSVIAFGSTPCRYACLPIRPLADFDRYIEDVRDGREDTRGLEIHYAESCESMGAGHEAAGMLATARRLLPLVATTSADAPFLRFTLGTEPREARP